MKPSLSIELLLAGLLMIGLPAAATAQWVIPSGASVQLSGGSAELADTDLRVAGALTLGSGAIGAVRTVEIGAGGSVDAGSGAITLSGNWQNAGGFAAGTSRVSFVDGLPAASSVTGNSRFHQASFVSALGKTYVLAAGSTQVVDGALTIRGLSTQPIQFASSSAGQVAFLDLMAGASQDIEFVGVSDVHAIGQRLAPAQTNQGGTGNDNGWFGIVRSVIEVPTLSVGFLVLLSLLVMTLALRQRQHS